MNDILVIRFSSLGDVVMSTAVIEALHRSFPDTHVHFLTRNEFTQVYTSDERMSEITGIQGHERPSAIVHALGCREYDVVIDLHGTLRSIAVAALVKAPVKLRINKHALGRRFMVWSRNRFRRRFDMLGSYLNTLSTLGITARVMPHMTPAPEALKMADGILGGERTAGFAPGAKHHTKCWNEVSYARVADKIAKQGFLPVFIGDSNDIEIIERIRLMMREKSVSYAGQIKLDVTIALISRLEFLVTNDSGPMHIAGALGVPFAAIFGPTHPDLGFVPGYPSGTILHSGITCSPCSLHGEKKCRRSKRFCMDDITREMVLKVVDKFINTKNRET